MEIKVINHTTKGASIPENTQTKYLHAGNCCKSICTVQEIQHTPVSLYPCRQEQTYTAPQTRADLHWSADKSRLTLNRRQEQTYTEPQTRANLQWTPDKSRLTLNRRQEQTYTEPQTRADLHWTADKSRLTLNNRAAVVPVTRSVLHFNHFLLLLLRSQLYLWGSPSWVRLLCMWPFVLFFKSNHWGSHIGRYPNQASPCWKLPQLNMHGAGIPAYSSQSVFLQIRGDLYSTREPVWFAGVLNFSLKCPTAVDQFNSMNWE